MPINQFFKKDKSIGKRQSYTQKRKQEWSKSTSDDRFLKLSEKCKINHNEILFYNPQIHTDFEV